MICFRRIPSQSNRLWKSFLVALSTVANTGQRESPIPYKVPLISRGWKWRQRQSKEDDKNLSTCVVVGVQSRHVFTS